MIKKFLNFQYKIKEIPPQSYVTQDVPSVHVPHAVMQAIYWLSLPKYYFAVQDGAWHTPLLRVCEESVQVRQLEANVPEQVSHTPKEFIYSA